MNALFRGVAQSSEDRYTWIAPVNGKENLIANFLAGCLINWSAAELPRVLIRSEERQILEKVFLKQKPVYPLQEIKKNEDEYQKSIEADRKKFHNRFRKFMNKITFNYWRYTWLNISKVIHKVSNLTGKLNIWINRYVS